MNEEVKEAPEDIEKPTTETSGGINWMYLVVLMILILAGVYYFRTKNTKPANPTATVVESSTLQENEVASSPNVSDIKENPDNQSIGVEGGMFYFKPNRIVVKKGVHVKISFTNLEGMHDFVIDELNVKSDLIGAGKTTTIEFTPTKLGEFEYYCSVSDHKARGMVGTLVVE